MCRLLAYQGKPQSLDGTTDSEHIFALLINELHTHPELPLEIALQRTLQTLRDLATIDRTTISAIAMGRD